MRQVAKTCVITGLLICSSGLRAQDAQVTTNLSDSSLSGLTLGKNTSSKPIFESNFNSLDSIANKGNRMQVSVRAEAQHRFSKTITFDFEGGGQFATGNSDSLFNNSPILAENRLLLRKAEFIYRPFDTAALTVGAIKSRNFNYRSVFGGSAYLGAKQEYRNSVNKLNFSIWALQGIPSNRNESNRVDQVDDGTPQLFIENLDLYYKAADNFKVIGSLGHFAYNNLPNSVADRSRFIGNSVFVYGGRGNSEFVYSYQGWLQKFGLQYEFNNWRFEPLLERVENTAAPSDNIGESRELALTKILGDQEFTVAFSNFTMGADATVGAYQSRGFALVNHTGEQIRIGFNDRANGLQVMAAFSRMQEINENQLVERDEINRAYFSIRKQYDLF